MNASISFDEITLTSENIHVGINSHGGYVSSWKIKNSSTGQFEDILYQGKTIKRSGIPILFPQFSKAKNIRQHGFARDSLWRLIKKEKTSATMELSSNDVSPDAKQEYPYPFITHITVELKENSVQYTLSVTNPGKSDLPISPGLHPYWAVDHAQKKDVRIDGVPDFNSRTVDWETSPPDIGYSYKEKTVVHLPNRNITIEDITPGGPIITHLVVWSQTPAKDDYHFVCVEPVCGYIGAFDAHPIMIASGRTWKMNIRFSAISS
jgi:galactose mutarotase-like enzyme